LLSSFRRKPESSKFNYFWMPDQVRHDGFGTFYETVKLNSAIYLSNPDNFQTIRHKPMEFLNVLIWNLICIKI
ncbi:MAG: hypothetical protein U9N83_19130, partial [Thermodesulfobacteriota bacterium]|nr:hypothetical protein [Thermodesulfobacteriota bacterium]